jgi:ribonuclease BN (tRNA processing enzyme)
MKLTIVGCGDAFGSGGRLQTCFHIDDGQRAMLLDCGATALIGMERSGLDPARVGAIQISHLHGDHFAGVVWWLLHAMYVAKRRQPLLIAGPVGIEVRVRQAVDVLFPGALANGLPFELAFMEQAAGRKYVIAGFTVTPYEVCHPSGAASHALRLERGDRTIAFSGDTEWVEGLVDCSQGADIFLCECYGHNRATRYHLTWEILKPHLPRIAARRVVLTHMSSDMLAAADVARAAGVVVAEDGMVIEL